MVKSVLVVACVCYCTICMHLAVTVFAATKLVNEQSNIEANGGAVASAIHTNHRQPDYEYAWADSSQKNTLNSVEEDSRSNRKDVPRKKRHAGGHHDVDDGIELNPSAQVFVRKLFQQFGNGEQETMNVTGFEQMLEHLGLYRMIEEFSHNVKKPKSRSDSGITNKKHAGNTNESVRVFEGEKGNERLGSLATQINVSLFSL